MASTARKTNRNDKPRVIPRAQPAKPAKPAKPANHARPEKAARPERHASPFIRICHDEALQARTLATLEALEKAHDPTRHREALSTVVIGLVDSGLDYCFLRPLKLAKAGFTLEQSARLGLMGVRQVLGSVIRQIIARMSGPQLLSVCDSIRQLMR